MKSDVFELGTINELSSFVLSVALVDATGAPSSPATLEWRLVCIDTDAVLQAWTAVTPTETSDASGTLVSVTVDISVDGTLHAMQTSSAGLERKALVVAADRGAGEYNAEARYSVQRLYART